MPTDRFTSLVYFRLVGKKKGYSVNRAEKKKLILRRKDENRSLLHTLPKK